MNFICKIIEDRPEEKKLIVKYCRQNAPKSIDEYSSCAIDYDHLDFNDYESFVDSLMKCGISTILNQLEQEPQLECNNENNCTYSTDISKNLNKILASDYKKIIFNQNVIKKIDL
jgi:hypothetical protein